MIDPKSEDRPGQREPWEKRSLIETIKVMFGGYAWPYVAPFVAAVVLGAIAVLAML